MYIFQLFRSFLPMHNPIGFGASDFLELLLALWLVLLALAWRPFLQRYSARLAVRTGWCMLILAILPVMLRLLLLFHHPIPVPDVYDEFGHLLVADTLRHFRLANPPHPMHEFFETQFVLQEPTYSSIYPIGQGLALAFGRMLFGTPWAGVLLSTAAFCALCYWMLRAWIAPQWALAGGLLAVMQFGPLNLWMNSYWGGEFAAAAGCLVFGALPRLREQYRLPDALLLGTGLGIHVLIRPYESIFLILSVLAFLAAFPRPYGTRLKPAFVLTLIVLAAIGVTLLQNKSVTGSWTALPYQLSQQQYGVPSALTFQSNPVPHRSLTPEQAMNYKMQLGFHGEGTDTIGSYLERLEYRIRFYRFYLLPPLYLVLPFFLLRLREFRFQWVAGTLLLFALGINFFPAFQFHYLAGVSCLFVLMSVAGLARLSQMAGGHLATKLILCVCAFHFLFWYSMHLFEDQDISPAMRQFEVWDAINHSNPDRRIAVWRQLTGTPSKQLVFVRYYPQHIFQDEWVYNDADIDASRVVWARDLGAEQNARLRRYFPDRTAWLFEPDFRPARLTRYPD